MAVYETSRANVAGLNLGGRVSFFVTNKISDLVSWNQTRLTKNALGKLSARELNDIGITRSDIANM